MKNTRALKKTCFFLIFTSLFLKLAKSNIFTFGTTCTSPAYLQQSYFNCKDCGLNQTAVTYDSMAFCFCSSGYFSTTVSGMSNTCTACASGQKSNYFGTACATSATCDVNSAYNKVNVDGTQSTSITCTTCYSIYTTRCC